MSLCAEALTTESTYNPPEIVQINCNPLHIDAQILKLVYASIILVHPFIYVYTLNQYYSWPQSISYNI